MNWKILKVFLSSTFKDLEITRDRLTNIFEEIEKSILKRCLAIRPYDLRWREKHTEEPIVQWCMRMVNQCDYFIGILGNRYGWRPPEDANGKKNIKKLSMTEMEIREALTVISPQKRFFCFTNFQDQKNESSEDIVSMENLKKYLQSRGEKIYICSNLEQLLDCIKEQFLSIIDKEYPANKKIVFNEQSIGATIDEFIEEKLKGFVGREKYLEEIYDFAKNDTAPNYLVLQAVAGTGKSALMGKFMRLWRTRENTPIVAHFLSLDGNSKDVKQILLHLVKELYENQILKETPENEIKSLSDQFANTLGEHSQKLVILIDGIDEVNESGRTLFWLPRNLPENIRIIITTRPVDTWEKLSTYPRIIAKEVLALKKKEVSQIIDSYIDEHGMQYSLEDKKVLINNCAGNPLYLKVGLDELRASGNSIEQLAMTVDGLFHQILNRLQQKYQKRFDENNIEILAEEFFEKYLGLIAAGRTGILEKELQEIFHVGDDILLPISKSLSNFIITRKGYLNFFHPEFERTIKSRLGKQKMRKMHESLVKYFQKKGIDYMRTLDELPNQLQWSENYDQLAKLLLNMDFLEAKCSRNMISGLRDDFYFALFGQVVGIPHSFSVEISSRLHATKEVIRLLYQAIKLDFSFLQKHPTAIFNCLWNRCYWHDSPQVQNRYRIPFSTPENQKMYRLAEYWLEKMNKKLWLRSMRPLPEQIDSNIISTLKGHKKSILTMDISRDKLVTGSKDFSVKIWDLKTEMCLLTFHHNHQVNSVSWSPQGKKVVSAAEDGNIRVWNIETGEAHNSIEQNNGVTSVHWHPEQQKIALGGRDGVVHIWDLESNKIETSLKGHSGGVFSVCWSPDGCALASSSKDKTIRIWDMATLQCIRILKGHTASIYNVYWNSKGDTLASSSNDIRIWKPFKGRCIAVLRNYHQKINSISWNSDANTLVSASPDKTIRFWDIEQEREMFFLDTHQGVINSLCWSKNKQLISGGSDGLIKIWKPQPEKFSISFEENKQKIRAISWHPTGNWIAIALQNGKVQIWDVKTIQVVKQLEVNKKLYDLAWSPSGNEIACLHEEIQIWNWQETKFIETILFSEGKNMFQKWKSSSTISNLYACQSEDEETLLMSNENEAYFPAFMKEPNCLASNYLTGYSPDYLYVFRICTS